MGELVLFMYLWSQGEIICATADPMEVPPRMSNVTVHRDWLDKLTPEERQLLIMARKDWLLTHQCPRVEKKS